MFNRKPKSESDKPSQKQDLSGLSITGSSGVMIGQAGGDLQQNLSAGDTTQQQSITQTQVVEHLADLESTVSSSTLTDAQKAEILDYLKPAKREAGKESPKKPLITQNLQQVGETVKSLKETAEDGESLWNTATKVFKAIAPWLGIALATLGL